MTVSDYLLTLIAVDNNLPEFAPQCPKSHQMRLPIDQVA